MKIINIQYGYRYEEQTTTLREYDNQQKEKSQVNRKRTQQSTDRNKIKPKTIT